MAVATAISKGARLIVLGACHVQRALKVFGNHPRLANMVRVHMGADDANYSLALQVLGENMLPKFSSLLVAESCIDDPPTITVSQQV